MSALWTKHIYKAASSAAGNGHRRLAAALITAFVVTTTPASAWDVNRGRSRMDDSPWVRLTVAALDPVYDKFGRSYHPQLNIRCLEDTTSIFVRFDGLFLGIDDMAIRYRVDTDPPRETVWQISTDYYAVGRWRRTVRFVRSLIERDRFLIDVFPHGESGMRSTFNITGLADVIDPLAEACHWSTTAPVSAPPAPGSPHFDALIDRLVSPTPD